MAFMSNLSSDIVSEGAFFLGTPGFVEDKSARGVAHIIAYERMMLLDDCRFVPDYVTYESLHGTHFAALDLEGNRLNGLSFDLAVLTDDVSVEILSRFAP